MAESQRDKMDTSTLHKILFTICVFSLIYKCYIGKGHVTHLMDSKFGVYGPYNTTKYIVEDDYDRLINIKNFTFKINPQPCKNYPAGLLLMVIVSSKPSNYENRKVIRNTWGRNFDFTKLVFLMGESENISVHNQILNESKKYKDIVQGNFVDVYRNMTYKHVMGLKWIAHHCPTARYILKTDDDILMNTRELRHFLATKLSPWGTKDLITCQALVNAKAQRAEKSKWHVTTDEYASEYYPTYCAGWAILYSQDVIPRLLKTAQSIPYFWIDDVHITGVCASMIGVERRSFSSLILSQSKANMLLMMGTKYLSPFIFGPPDISSEKINEIWKAIPE